MDLELDKLSVKVLDALYKKDLTGDKIAEMIGWLDQSQPNEIISYLRRESLISVKISGEPDGEGGYIDETVTHTYSITRRGRAFIEAERDRKKDKWLDRISNIIP